MISQNMSCLPIISLENYDYTGTLKQIKNIAMVIATAQGYSLGYIPA